ncbi:MAG: hypothetical protein K1X61_15825 [Chitinophagales bacterium]|nr:hypothetical protein [Chitinophagales bacterium]
MKSVKFILSAGIMLAIWSCSSPSDNAAKKADEAVATAEDQATVAAEQRAAADANAVNAVANVVVANADELMSKVPMPTFAGKEAELYAKAIGNHIVDFVNAKDATQASVYAAKVKDELTKVDELTAKGKISAADSKSIKDYATALMKAAGITPAQ